MEDTRQTITDSAYTFLNINTHQLPAQNNAKGDTCPHPLKQRVLTLGTS
jgi:hypothetical protein